VREVLGELLAWCRAGQAVTMATVVGTWRSAPRPAGAVMLVGPDGTVVGSVSGGCVEADVLALAESVAETGRPVLRRYGVGDADAAAVGLTCGGELEIYVEEVAADRLPELDRLAAAVAANQPVAVVTVVEHRDPSLVGRRLLVHAAAGEPDGPPERLVSERADAAVAADARGLLAAGRSGPLTYGPDGERSGSGMRVFAASLAPRPRMLIFGASDFAAALAGLGSFLGFRVTVCDARGLFATRDRFPTPAEVVVEWPHRYLAGEARAGRTDAQTTVCVLTHDPKFDVPLLEVALRLPLGYVGAMGSRQTHADRLERLRACGLSAAELGRLYSPIGLDLGGRTPEETALSIAAEIVGLRWGGRGRRLGEVEGRIHHEPG